MLRHREKGGILKTVNDIPYGHRKPLIRPANPYEDRNLRRKIEKADNEDIIMLAIRKYLKGVQIHKKVTMEYLWVEKNKRRDLDNVSSFGRKVIQDALVKSGVLANDGWEQISGFSDAFQVDARNPRIEVLIREVET